ncbi:hypothetical protein [Burkholderia pseudomallei]|uniref:hypothetical protein n=1 Tax=Burkholderia pseudomallei TaxID=28450 RepID=UPI00163FD95F|nr:hypothetical protein [Burkholderia pseudomallei]
MDGTSDNTVVGVRVSKFENARIEARAERKLARYSCETPTEIVRHLHQQAGIEGGNALATRRTFAVRLHRDCRSLKLIQELIGVSSLPAVKNLIDGDPVRLSAIVRGVI